MSTATKSAHIIELDQPTDQEIIDAVAECRPGQKIVIYCRSAAQWESMDLIVREEFPHSLFRCTKQNDSEGQLTLKISIL